MYFERRREEHIASINGVIPRGRLNAERRRGWWGVPGRTLEAVLDHIKTDNVSRLAVVLLSPPRQVLDAAANGADVLVFGLRLDGSPSRQARAGGDTAAAPSSSTRVPAPSGAPFAWSSRSPSRACCP